MTRKQARISALFISLILISSGFFYAGEIRIGAHGGISIPDIRGDRDDPFTGGFTSRQGPFFGVFAEMGLSEHFSLAAELNYTSQGGKRDGLQIITPSLLPSGLLLPPGTVVYADFRNESILDYVEVPLLGRLALGNKVRCFVNAGPYVGFLVRARALTEGKSFFYLDRNRILPVIIPPAAKPLEVDMTADTDVKNSLKRTNFGVSGGAGVMIPLGPGEVVIDARFQLGLTVVQKDIEKTGEGRTGAFIISAGYSLPLGGKRDIRLD
jgi:Outer membrane protein beta-barrel domain